MAARSRYLLAFRQKRDILDHMDTVIIIAVIAVMFGVYMFVRGRGPSPKTAELKRRYFRLLNQPQGYAEEVLERTIASLRQKYPGRSYGWYLEKAVYDLERDRL